VRMFTAGPAAEPDDGEEMDDDDACTKLIRYIKSRRNLLFHK